MVEQKQLMHNNAQELESGRVDIADLLADLAAQIDNVRRLFGSTPENAHTSANAQPADVVFIDDLAHCMECSWARLEAAGIQPPSDVVAQCGRLLEASLQILHQVQRLQADKSHPSNDA